MLAVSPFQKIVRVKICMLNYTDRICFGGRSIKFENIFTNKIRRRVHGINFLVLSMNVKMMEVMHPL